MLSYLTYKKNDLMLTLYIVYSLSMFNN